MVFQEADERLEGGNVATGEALRIEEWTIEGLVHTDEQTFLIVSHNVHLSTVFPPSYDLIAFKRGYQDISRAVSDHKLEYFYIHCLLPALSFKEQQFVFFFAVKLPSKTKEKK